METNKTKFSEFYEAVREYEREQAPGSETGLWGAFIRDFNEAWRNWEDDQADSAVDDAVAATWYEAYEAQAIKEEAGEPYELSDLF